MNKTRTARFKAGFDGFTQVKGEGRWFRQLIAGMASAAGVIPVRTGIALAWHTVPSLYGINKEVYLNELGFVYMRLDVFKSVTFYLTG